MQIIIDDEVIIDCVVLNIDKIIDFINTEIVIIKKKKENNNGLEQLQGLGIMAQTSSTVNKPIDRVQRLAELLGIRK